MLLVKKNLLSRALFSCLLIGTSSFSYASDDIHQASADTHDVQRQINDVVQQSRSELRALNVGNGNYSVPETNESELLFAMKSAEERRRLQSLTALTTGAGL